MATSEVGWEAQLGQFDEEEEDEVTLPDLMKKAVNMEQTTNKTRDPSAKQKAQSALNVDDITAVKKKRTTTGLSPALLLGKDGLDNLRGRLDRMSPASVSHSGHELVDLDRLLQVYRSWSENLAIRESGNWADFVEKLDRLKKGDIRKYYTRLREGEVLQPTVAQQKQTGIQTPVVAASTSFKKLQEPTFPPPTNVPMNGISEEQKLVIEAKKQEALKKREERLSAMKAKQLEATGNIDSFSQATTQRPSVLPSQVASPSQNSIIPLHQQHVANENQSTQAQTQILDEQYIPVDYSGNVDNEMESPSKRSRIEASVDQI